MEVEVREEPWMEGADGRRGRGRKGGDTEIRLLPDVGRRAVD
jgi:hypothetical protein